MALQDANNDLVFVRATSLRRFDARSSGQRTLMSSALPSRNGMEENALRAVLSDRTPSAGPPRVLESPENPFADGLAVPPVSVNGSSNNGDIDDDFSAPSERTVHPATSPTEFSR
jgi:hypothetical protein